ncbi:hypothetical protein GF312_11245 [Candidatus Poribacteria bacterium]|nr:hypothetical protein [Candidatus Poribacteria bacterium]
MNHSAVALTIFLGIAQASGTVSGANVIDLNHQEQSSQRGAVLFPFDSYSIPFRHGLQLELIQAKRYEGNPVLEPGGLGKVDTNAMAYYGTVIEIDGKLHMWYLGRGDVGDMPLRICYATSNDGFQWEKPNLGLVEYSGNSQNNLVDLDWDGKAMSCCVLYDPDDPDLERRFKIFSEVESPTSKHQGCVAFSPDGLRWTTSPHNPVTHVRIEPTGIIRKSGCYYVVGQNAGFDRGFQKRVLISLASYDFEHWTDASVLGFRRDAIPPSPVVFGHNMGKQVHLGAGLWDRGNAILGLYGQWNASNETDDRREMRMDIGLVVSQDAVHYREPIPDFRLIDTTEEGWKGPNPLGDPPRFAQGQGIVNIGDKTITWYSIWGRGGDNSIRAAYWKRDRLGYFSPTRTPIEGQAWVDEVKPHFISAPIRIGSGSTRIFVNASGLSEHSQITVEVLNERFEKLDGYTDADFIPWSDDSSVRLPVRWQRGAVITGISEPIRIRVNWDGLRLEDARVYAVYVEMAE